MKLLWRGGVYVKLFSQFSSQKRGGIFRSLNPDPPCSMESILPHLQRRHHPHLCCTEFFVLPYGFSSGLQKITSTLYSTPIFNALLCLHLKQYTKGNYTYIYLNYYKWLVYFVTFSKIVHMYKQYFIELLKWPWDGREIEL